MLIRTTIQRIYTPLPRSLKSLLHPVVRLIRPRLNRLLFQAEFGFLPPPNGTDICGYEKLLRIIKKYNLLEIEGDLVEIGVFLGGGTYKLAKYLEQRRSAKKVFAIDIFDIYFDNTTCSKNITMAELYERHIKHLGTSLSQFEIFEQVTKNCSNIEVIKSDTKKVAELPTNSICFGFIDGNHAREYVINDFNLVWSKLSPGGMIALDDYGYDLPQVTETIDDLIRLHRDEITSTFCIGKIIFLQRKETT